MTESPSRAERIDHAIGHLLEGASVGVASATAGLTSLDRPVIVAADRLRVSLGLPAVSPRFEARLGTRLAGAVPAREAMAWALRHPGRLIVTGALGSAVGVGVGVTAFAVWRSGRRAAGPAHRLLHR